MNMFDYKTRCNSEKNAITCVSLYIYIFNCIYLFLTDTSGSGNFNESSPGQEDQSRSGSFALLCINLGGLWSLMLYQRMSFYFEEE